MLLASRFHTESLSVGIAGLAKRDEALCGWLFSVVTINSAVTVLAGSLPPPVSHLGLTLMVTSLRVDELPGTVGLKSEVLTGGCGRLQRCCKAHSFLFCLESQIYERKLSFLPSYLHAFIWDKLVWLQHRPKELSFK